MTAEQRRDCFLSLMFFLGVSFALHLAWEVVQLPLYTIWRTGTAREIAFAIVHCTAGDLMIATLSLGLSVLVFGNGAWLARSYGAVAVSAAVIGISYTVFSERLNLARGNWTYSELMPLVPGLDIGLSPLFQWMIVPSIALYFAAPDSTRRAVAPN